MPFTGADPEIFVRGGGSNFPKILKSKRKKKRRRRENEECSLNRLSIQLFTYKFIFGRGGIVFLYNCNPLLSYTTA